MRFLCSLLGGAWAQEAAGVVCGVGVGYLEALMLRYGGMPAPRVLMGCRKGFPAGFRGVDSMLSGSGWCYTKRPPGGAVHQRGC